MKLSTISAAFALTLATATSAQADQLWVFGDSLSDNGNLSLLFATDGNPNTYLPAAYTPYAPFPGLNLQRISNGKTTMEYVAEYYGAPLYPSFLQGQLGDQAANNFAIFGARASLTSRLDLPYQVAQLAERVFVRGLDVSNDRAVLAIGSNDVFAAWSTAVAPLATGGAIDVAAGEAILDAAVASLRTYIMDEGLASIPSPSGDGTQIQVPSLVGMGITQFVILNSPDIGTTPWVNNTAAQLGDDRVRRVATRLTNYFNRKLARLVDDMEDECLDVIDVDLQGISDAVRAQSKRLGFTNKTDDCFLTNTLATLTQGLAPTPGVYRNTCSAETANQFMFLDTAHPTAKVHEETGKRVVRSLRYAH